MTTLEEAASAGTRLRGEQRQVGARVLRLEDRRLVTGQGLFTDDIDAGAYGAAFVRSPYAHARVVSIDVTAALDVPGLVAIYTHEDLPERIGAILPLLIPHPSLFAPRTGYPLARRRRAPRRRGRGDGRGRRSVRRRGRRRACIR